MLLKAQLERQPKFGGLLGRCWNLPFHDQPEPPSLQVGLPGLGQPTQHDPLPVRKMSVRTWRRPDGPWNSPWVGLPSPSTSGTDGRVQWEGLEELGRGLELDGL